MSETLIGVLIGSILTLAGVALTNRSNRRNLKLQMNYQAQQDSKKFKLAKLEELHNLVSVYAITSTSFSARIQIYKIEQISLLEFQELLDLLLKPATSIGTLINLYAPDLKSDFDHLLDKVTELNVAARDVIINKKPVTIMNEMMSEFHLKCTKILKKIEIKSREQDLLQIDN